MQHVQVVCTAGSISHTNGVRSSQRSTRRSIFPEGGMGVVTVSEPAQQECHAVPNLGEEGPFTRARNRLGTAFHAQLTQQIADVLLDRRQRNHQFAGDLLVGCASQEQV
jgi:hypothetical protein